ncbi:H-NS histone family protein [Bradyrhizobium roseum]|uniref:H-NS histone family protein n=1 Tax=Bradyrhizobium roseum TaxID=3056648 RepID=UPI00263815ED|nr:H-NS histone family protein [Bradyrhizobium roseus]WKA25618.1 H-NS histone family protein [Bradyrhizobium roseus]
MNSNDFKSMSTDELWALHEEVAKRLAAALTAEKSLLESRLKLLQRGIEIRPATPANKPAAAANKSPVAKSSGRKRLGARPPGAKSSGAKSSRAKSSRAKALRVRRPYPVVVPKYRNPEQPSETWAGRGKTPRWLAAQLKSGRRIDDFRIRYAA